MPNNQLMVSVRRGSTHKTSDAAALGPPRHVTGYGAPICLEGTVSGARAGHVGVHAVLQTEVGDEDHDWLVAFVASEMHVTGTFSEALAGAVPRPCAGAIGAVVERERAGLDDGRNGGAVIV